MRLLQKSSSKFNPLVDHIKNCIAPLVSMGFVAVAKHDLMPFINTLYNVVGLEISSI